MKGEAYYPAIGGAPGPEAPLLPRANLFEHGSRPRRDAGWLVAYVATLAAALGGGWLSFIRRNTRYSELLDPTSFANPKLCPISTPGHARRLLQMGDDAPSPFDLDLFMKSAGLWMAASAGGAILVGLLFVWLVQHAPRGLVGFALALQVCVPAAVGTLALTQGLLGPAIPMLVFAALTLLLFALWRPQIELVTQLLGVAGKGLAGNPGLVPMALGLQLVVGVLEVPLVLACIAALMNGQLAYNPDRTDGGKAEAPEQCVGEDGGSVLCCVWETEPWVPAFMALAGVAMLWTLFVAFEVKMFTVAGAVAQWFFSPAAMSLDHTSASAGPSPAGAGAGPSPRRGSGSRVMLSLGHALGPQLGSLCCGGAVLTLVALVRQAIEKARKESRTNLAMACAAACLSLLLAFVEYITRFATIRAAITGEAFMLAGRNVVGLLKRNAMNAFGVWWLPPMILRSCTFVLAAAWAMTVWLTSYATTWHDKPQGKASASILAGITFVAAWAVLGFLASLLINVIDVIFVCVAMDRDMGQVSHPLVYAVYEKLPSVGTLVEQPDGHLVYGAPGMAPPQHGSVARV